jgi:hypothetical protein
MKAYQALALIHLALIRGASAGWSWLLSAEIAFCTIFFIQISYSFNPCGPPLLSVKPLGKAFLGHVKCSAVVCRNAPRNSFILIFFSKKSYSFILDDGKLHGKRYARLGVEDMAKGKHKPPSRVKYDLSHPVVSCRLDKATRDLLKQRLTDLGGISFAAFVKDSLGLLQLKMTNIEEKIIDEWQIWYPCCICGRRIDIKPNGGAHEAFMALAERSRWAHKECISK